MIYERGGAKSVIPADGLDPAEILHETDRWMSHLGWQLLGEFPSVAYWLYY